MRLIVKKREPRSLTEHRTQSHAGFDNFSSKDELRRALVDEQHGLCCYCMSRIGVRSREMVIEHWEPQSTHPHLQLVYTNLFGACLGNRGKPPSLQHCDSSKGSTVIKLNPLNSAQVKQLRYRDNGEVFVDDDQLRSDVDGPLNLNVQSLVRNRRDILENFIAGLNSRYGAQTWSVALLKKELRRLETTVDGELQAYVEVLSYWLRKRLGEHGR